MWGLIIAAILLSLLCGILIKFRYLRKENKTTNPFFYFLGKVF